VPRLVLRAEGVPRQGVAEAECRRAADAAEAAYRGAFDRGLPAEEARLDAEHARCLALAASAFAAVAVGEPSVREVRAGAPRAPRVGLASGLVHPGALGERVRGLQRQPVRAARSAGAEVSAGRCRG